ncbi:MAG: DUF3306 domain-containing protein [Alphaproteobacteria bacterium]
MAGRDAKTDKRDETGAADEGFLGRWSRRKADARGEEKTAAVAPAAALDRDAADLPAADAPEPPAFDIDSLPDIDSLGPESDFRVFMQAGVPPALKTRALRKLWRLKPELANLDGLVDYGEDLTGSFKVVDHLKTAYQVGRGFLKSVADEEEPGRETPHEGQQAAPASRPLPQHEQESLSHHKGDDVSSSEMPQNPENLQDCEDKT